MRDILPERFEKLGGHLTAFWPVSVAFEWSMKKPGGTEHHLAFLHSGSRQSGVVRGFIALTQDIAGKRNEDALRARERNQGDFAALPDVISRFDHDLRILYKSPAVELYGSRNPCSARRSRRRASRGTALKLDECLRSVFARAPPDRGVRL